MSCCVAFTITDLIDSLLMLFEKRRLRRLNSELFLWNGVGVISVSSVWALAQAAWGNIGAWTTWFLIGTAIFSILGAINAAIASASD